MTAAAVRVGAKAISKWAYLPPGKIICKKSKSIIKQKKLTKCLKFDSSCTGWESMPPKYVKDQFIKLCRLTAGPLMKGGKLF